MCECVLMLWPQNLRSLSIQISISEAARVFRCAMIRWFVISLLFFLFFISVPIAGAFFGLVWDRFVLFYFLPRLFFQLLQIFAVPSIAHKCYKQIMSAKIVIIVFGCCCCCWCWFGCSLCDSTCVMNIYLLLHYYEIAEKHIHERFVMTTKCK